MPSFTVRTDPEVENALSFLGVTPDDRNRSKVVKDAILFFAEHKRQQSTSPDERTAAIDSAIALLREAR